VDLLYAPSQADDHVDHKAVSHLASSFNAKCTVRYYEIWTPLSAPNLNIDITAHVAIKRAAIRCHKTQVVRNDFVEGILALNMYRGLVHGPHRMYAESFLEVRPGA
jgi:LmbE family N-acetylglucosaminyl deacetylase